MGALPSDPELFTPERLASDEVMLFKLEATEIISKNRVSIWEKKCQWASPREEWLAFIKLLLGICWLLPSAIILCHMWQVENSLFQQENCQYCSLLYPLGLFSIGLLFILIPTIFTRTFSCSLWNQWTWMWTSPCVTVHPHASTLITFPVPQQSDSLYLQLHFPSNPKLP